MYWFAHACLEAWTRIVRGCYGVVDELSDELTLELET